jgi:hypothetical protein
LESEFETTEEAEAYEAWLRAKVAAVLAKPGARIPHDEAVAQLRELIERKRNATSRLGR